MLVLPHDKYDGCLNIISMATTSTTPMILVLVQIDETCKFLMNKTVNLLGPSDAIWRWRSWSTLVQVMACCLTAPSHYLNQCWLVISKVLWHSSDDIIKRTFKDNNQWSKIENNIFKITLRSPRGQWVNSYPRKHTHGTYYYVAVLCWSVILVIRFL